MRYFAQLAVPERPYRPGDNLPKPTIVIPGAERALEHGSFREHAGLAAGIDLFNLGFYWEAHDIWEASWRNSDGRERELLQGLIQLAAARLHHAQGNAAGADRLFERAMRHLAAARDAGAIFCGIDIDELDGLTETIRWKIRSRDLPGARSDLAVQPLECCYHLSTYGVVQTTPTRGDYYSGNTIYLDDPIDQAELDVWRQRCAEEIKLKAAYHNVQWELEGEAFGAKRENLDQLAVLRARELSQLPAIPSGVEVRALSGDEDWNAAAALSIEINEPEWGPVVRPFTRWRYAAFRRTVELYGGGFFGAFVAGELASCLGAVRFEDGFRYQDVQTRVPFRRRGIARLMCAQVFSLMREGGATHGVIIADAGSIAEKLYRSLGFEQVSTSQAFRFKVDEE